MDYGAAFDAAILGAAGIYTFAILAYCAHAIGVLP